MKSLYIQLWFNDKIIDEVKVSESENFKANEDILLSSFINNDSFKLVWK